MSKSAEGTPRVQTEEEKDFDHLLDFAVTIDTADVVYGALAGGKPRYTALEQSTYVNHVRTGEMDEIDPAILMASTERFTRWINYTHHVIRHVVTFNPDMEPREIVAIGDHPKTAFTLAALSSHNDGISDIMVRSIGRQFFSLSDDRTHLLASAEAMTVNGLQHYPHTVFEDRIVPSQAFSRYVPWATEVAARSILGHRVASNAPLRVGAYGSVPLFNDSTFVDAIDT